MSAVQVEWDFEKTADEVVIPFLEQHGYWRFGYPEVLFPKLHYVTSPLVVIRRFGHEPYLSITLASPDTVAHDFQPGQPLSFTVKRCLADARGFQVRYSLLTDGEQGILFLNGAESFLARGEISDFGEDIDRRVVVQDRLARFPCDVDVKEGSCPWRAFLASVPEWDPIVLWAYLCEFTTLTNDNRDRVGTQLAEFYRHRENPLLPEYDLVNPARRVLQRLSDTFGLLCGPALDMDQDALRKAMEAVYVWPRWHLLRETLEATCQEIGGVYFEGSPDDIDLPEDWLNRTFETTPQQAPSLCQRLVGAYQDYNERVFRETEEAVTASYDEIGRGDLFKAAAAQAVRPEPVAGFRRRILMEQVKVLTDRPEALRAARMSCILRMTARMRAFTD